MSKHDLVKLTIINTTESTFRFVKNHFKQGHLAEGEQWPEIIKPKRWISVECKPPSFIGGCSGWVSYTRAESSPPAHLYFTFDHFKMGVGRDEKHARNSMKNRLATWQMVFSRDSPGKYVTVDLSSDGGYFWQINDVDTNIITAANDEVRNVEAVYNSIDENKGAGAHYMVDDHSVYSHFKGVGISRDKLIFTHTNVAPKTKRNGLYLLGNISQPYEDRGFIEAVYETDHDPIWGHPGGVQVCGSYMAMAFQKSDDSTHHSEICIYDIRETQINKPMSLVTKITRSRGNGKEKLESAGINGVGMTKESGDDGRYIVACSDGWNLDVYRSNQCEITAGTSFEKLKIKKGRELEEELKSHIHGGAGLGLITQQDDGQLYFIGMHASDDGPSTLNLYKLTISGDSASYEKVGKEKEMNTQVIRVIPIMAEAKDENLKDVNAENNVDFTAEVEQIVPPSDNTDTKPKYADISFRWGKGLAINTPDWVEVYATCRNINSKGMFEVAKWSGSNIDFCDVKEEIDVEQSYSSESGELTTYWDALPEQSYEVLVNDQNGVQISREIKTVRDTPKGRAQCQFNITEDLEQSEEGSDLISAVRMVRPGKEPSMARLRSPYLDATPLLYRLGQASIETLEYNSGSGLLTGTWNIPEPGDGAPQFTGYDYQIIEPDKDNQVIAANHENDGSGKISISTQGLDLMGGIPYQLQIRATGGNNVVPGEWSVPENFQVTPLYQFPPPSSNINNAPKNSTGYFVIGDEEAKVGDYVTFWGGNWTSANSLSGGKIDPSLSSFRGYVFVNETEPKGTCQGAFNPEINSGVSIEYGNTYSMPVVSSLKKGTDTGLSDHYVAIAGTFTKIVNVQVTSTFYDDYSLANAGRGKVVSILWEATS